MSPDRQGLFTNADLCESGDIERSPTATARQVIAKVAKLSR